jgi:ribosomal protein S18 acetylase RimI-like enzyme
MVTIELASEHDIPRVKHIADIRTNKRYLGWVNRARLGESIRKSELHVARLDDIVIGFIRWHRRKDGWTTVYELCVDESHRKLGIGQQLMCITGTGPVKLKCHSSNPAIHFYKRLGFKVVSTEITKGGKQLDFLTRA